MLEATVFGARRLALAVTLVFGVGCTPAPRALTWEFVASDAERVERVTRWEARIRAGGCPVTLVDPTLVADGGLSDGGVSDGGFDGSADGGFDGSANESGPDSDADGGANWIWTTQFLRDSPTPLPPPVLAAGDYALLIIGRDDDCVPVLAGCETISLPAESGTRVRVSLERAAGPGCTTCSPEACEPRYRTCSLAHETGLSCSDRRDDDCDGLADCLDEDCAGGPRCACASDSDCRSCESCELLTGACVPAREPRGCTNEGFDGQCLLGRCCTGCVQGEECVAGTTRLACGIEGASCQACPCTQDACLSGACEARGTAVRVSAGEGYTCAIVEDGSLYCWGRNDSGQLGIGTTADSPTPTLVECDGCQWTAIAAGTTHTCGIRIERGQERPRLYCWGSNTQLQLGVGNISFRVSPVEVGGELRTTAVPEAVDVGDQFTCAIARTEAEPARVYCWGSNSEQRLGSRPASGRATPMPLEGWLESAPAYSPDFVDVELGRAHACALSSPEDSRAPGRIWCWGANQRRQLGVTDVTQQTVSQPAQIAANRTYIGLGLGGDHSCAASLQSNGLHRIWCWGANDAGQLGYGGTNQRNAPNVPLLVSSRAPWEISASATHTCIHGDEIHCFGSNSEGQITDQAVNTEVPIEIPGDWNTVGAGFDHTCLIGASGQLRCVGANTSGQLGAEGSDRTCL